MKRKKYIALYPLSLVYALITGIRNFLYNSGTLKSHEFRFPVICIGNITVGGTGKTPHCEYLIELLKQNFTVALLSRGYKRSGSGFRYVTELSDVAESGDEPLQIRRKFPDITVAVDANRVEAVGRILEEKPNTEVIILDDGFQHRQINAGLSVLLTDYNRLMIDDYLMPYGELRESVTNMYRADIIIVTKTPENLSPIQRRLIVKNMDKAAYQNLFFTSIRYKELCPVFDQGAYAKGKMIFKADVRPGILLVTGIADATPLKEHLMNKTDELIHLSYPDHQRFTDDKIKKIIEAYESLNSATKFIITTEKDAVRLREFANIADGIKSSFFYLPIGISFLNNDKEEFDKLILEYVRKNKRNNRISEIKGL